MTFIIYATEIFRAIMYLTTAIGLILVAYYGVKALKVENAFKKMEEEKREQIKRLKAINDHYEKFIDKD